MLHLCVGQTLLDSDEAVLMVNPEADVKGQDEVTMKRMKMAFRALGVAMVPLTASMPQVGNHRNTVTATSQNPAQGCKIDFPRL